MASAARIHWKIILEMALLDFSSSLRVRSDVEPLDSSLVRLFVSEITIEQYFSVALATVLVYHSIITLDKEVRYFWPSPRSFVSIIYFANRYIGILSTVSGITFDLFTQSLASCRFSYWTNGLANLITILLIDYILLIRVLALFHQNKRLGIILKVLFGLEACIVLGITVYSILFQGVAVGILTERMTMCGSNRFPPRTLSIVLWLAPMVYGMILLVLALYKAAEYWKLSSGFKGFILIRVLVQDQVIYYGFVIFCCVCQTVFNSIAEISPFTTDIMSLVGSPTLLCILGGQLLVNLKEAGERGANCGTNYTLTRVSDIDFGENDAADEHSTGTEQSTGTESSV